MPGHGVKQSAANVRNYVKKQVGDAIHRFDAEPWMKESMQLKKNMSGKKQNALLDVASFRNVRLANDIIKNMPSTGEVADWRRRTRNNELAKSVALYAVPVAAIEGGVAAYHKIKKRKDEDKMEKMSAEQYTEFVQKLAEEITDEVMSDDGMEVVAGEGLDADEIASRALQAYEAAQMRKQASEQDYLEACAYEDAAMLILDGCED